MSLLPQYRKTNQRADAPETTEWQDIFHKKFDGTYANEVYEKLVEAENIQQETQVREQRLQQNLNTKLNSDASSSTDDDFLDEEDRKFFYQEVLKRKQLIYYQHSAKKYLLRRISRSEYVTEVSENVNYLVYIDSEHLRECKFVHALLQQINYRFPSLKMTVIDYYQASSNMPEQLCPLLVIYKKGDYKPVKTGSLAGLLEIGGWQTNSDELARKFAKLGLIDYYYGDAEKEEEYNRILRKRIKGETGQEETAGSDEST